MCVPFRSGRFQPLPLVTQNQRPKCRGKNEKWDGASVFVALGKGNFCTLSLGAKPVLTAEVSNSVTSHRGPATCWPLLLVSFHLVYFYTPLTLRTGEEQIPGRIWFGENI